MNLKFIIIAVLAGIAFQTTGLTATLIDFEELVPTTPADAPGLGAYFDGHGFNATPGTWTSQGVEFNTGQFGPGWSYSNVNDTTTSGFLNQFSAITGTGVGGSGNYATTNYSAFAAKDGGPIPFINLPIGFTFSSIAVTNTTYSALSMRDGDSFAKKFGGPSGSDPDLFKAILTGFDSINAQGTSTGIVEVVLADYTFADDAQDYILTTWMDIDLTSLGDARSLGVTFFSTDTGDDGINTPTFMAIDNLTITAVPEPGSLIMFGLMSLASINGYRRSRRRNLKSPVPGRPL